MNWELFLQVVGLIATVWGAYVGYQKVKTRHHYERLQNEKKSKEAIKNLEKALSEAQFSQLGAKVTALESLFNTVRIEVKEMSSEVRKAKEDMIQYRESMKSVSKDIDRFVQSTEKRLDDLYGKVKVIENKTSKLG